MTARTITIRTIYHNAEGTDDGEFERQLRHRMLKLRWIGYEAEADAIAERLRRLHLDSRGFIPALLETD